MRRKYSLGYNEPSQDLILVLFRGKGMTWTNQVSELMKTTGM